MTHTPEPRFIVIPEIGIINAEDISTVLPYPEHTTGAPSSEAGMTVTFMSKATYVHLPGMTVEGFASLLNGAVF